MHLFMHSVIMLRRNIWKGKKVVSYSGCRRSSNIEETKVACEKSERMRRVNLK